MFKRLQAFFLDILEVVFLAVAIFLFIYLLILQPHRIKGESMEPNFFDAEFILTDKVSYRFGKPQRGEVIVFKAPPEMEEEYIKRIIGLPGESISIKDNKVFINGKQIIESYLDPTLPTSGGYFLQEGEIKVIPPDAYFVLGDNRTHSSDSRAWGFVPKSDITGRAWLIYWPPKKSGIIKNANYSL
jgi:signal peptidase I